MAGTSPAKTKLAGEFPPLAAAKIFPRTALRLRGGSGRGDRLRGLALYAESKTAPGVPVDQAVGHFGAHSGDEVAAGAMHRDDHVGGERLDLRDRVLDVIRRCNTEVEAA